MLVNQTIRSARGFRVASSDFFGELSGEHSWRKAGQFQEYDPIVLIDATMDGAPAGTVRLLKPRFASGFPRTLSAHDIGLRDLLESAALLGPLPTRYLITVSIERLQSMSLDLSPRETEAIPEVIRSARDILSSRVA